MRKSAGGSLRSLRSRESSGDSEGEKEAKEKARARQSIMIPNKKKIIVRKNLPEKQFNQTPEKRQPTDRDLKEPVRGQEKKQTVMDTLPIVFQSLIKPTLGIGPDSNQLAVRAMPIMMNHTSTGHDTSGIVTNSEDNKKRRSSNQGTVEKKVSFQDKLNHSESNIPGITSQQKHQTPLNSVRQVVNQQAETRNAPQRNSVSQINHILKKPSLKVVKEEHAKQYPRLSPKNSLKPQPFSSFVKSEIEFIDKRQAAKQDLFPTEKPVSILPPTSPKYSPRPIRKIRVSPFKGNQMSIEDSKTFPSPDYGLSQNSFSNIKEIHPKAGSRLYSQGQSPSERVGTSSIQRSAEKDMKNPFNFDKEETQENLKLSLGPVLFSKSPDYHFDIKKRLVRMEDASDFYSEFLDRQADRSWKVSLPVAQEKSRQKDPSSSEDEDEVARRKRLEMSNWTSKIDRKKTPIVVPMRRLAEGVSQAPLPQNYVKATLNPAPLVNPGMSDAANIKPQADSLDTFLSQDNSPTLSQKKPRKYNREASMSNHFKNVKEPIMEPSLTLKPVDITSSKIEELNSPDSPAKSAVSKGSNKLVANARRVIKPYGKQQQSMKETNEELNAEFKEMLYSSVGYQKKYLENLQAEKSEKLKEMMNKSRHTRQEDVIDEMLIFAPTKENMAVLRERNSRDDSL